MVELPVGRVARGHVAEEGTSTWEHLDVEPPSFPKKLQTPDKWLRAAAMVSYSTQGGHAAVVFPVGPETKDACMAAIKNGISAKMRYIRKHQRISIGFLHDAMDDKVHDDRKTVRVDSADNTADVFTKPLDDQSFAKHRLTLGIRP